MNPETRLEERLRDALRRPDGSTWPDERGAFDRFRRRRRRRGRALAAGAILAVVAATAVVVAAPRLLPRPVAPVTPPERVAREAAGGFEVAVPAGWTTLKRGKFIVASPLGPEAPAVVLRPMRRAAETKVLLYTSVLAPDQYPGVEPGTDPDPSVTAARFARRLDNAVGTLGRGRRPDGRPYVWRTRLRPGEVAEYAIAWPYHCNPDQACHRAARWRALLVSGKTAEDAATGRRVLQVVQRLVETVRPVTNALPGGAPGWIDPVVPQVKGRWLLGTGGSGRGAWQAWVRQGGDLEDGFELHFPALKTRPGRGVHAEDIELGYLNQGELGALRDCLSWLPRQVMLLSGAVPENVASVRVELAGRPPVTAAAFGHDRPARWAAFVSPPLPRGTRVTAVVALDAAGRTVAEDRDDPTLSHPACHVFR
jgi:hypothetical protein